MTKLIKYLKPFWLFIIVVIGLLFTQAMCDLALPEYMSKIVNTGIQQNGIENAIPDVIRKTEFEKVITFMSDEEIKTIKNNYILIDKASLDKNTYNKYLKKYPLLKNEALYKLDIKEKQDKELLNNIMGKNIVITATIEKSGLDELQTNNSNVPKNIDPYVLFKNMPKEQLNNIKEKINVKIKDIPDSMITQSATLYIKNEYQAIGMDVNQIQKNYIIIAGFKMVGIALLSMLVSVSVGLLGSRISAGLGRNLRKSLFSKVESFSNVDFNKFGASSLITRTTNDVNQVQNIMMMLLRIVFYAPILGIGGVMKVLSTNTSMGWIVLVAIALISVIVIIMFLFAVPKFKIVQKLIDRLNLVTRESLTGMLVIRAFNTEKYEEEKFEKANTDLTKTNLFIGRLMSFMMPLMMLVMNGVTILIVWVGAHQINDGVIQVGDMMAFIQYTMQIIMAFLMITMISIMLPRASVSANRIDEVLSTKSTITDPKEPKKFDNKTKGNVIFKNVSFKYPDADDYVIKNISFEAKPGETTAFIGSTGSGKSTIVNLIPRFYDVSEGKIIIDGVDIREVSQYDLRQKIGFVPQKGILFSGDIESNLKYGKEDASEQDMINAVTTSQALEFIETKDKKFKTEIAQGGTNVSGGQKQRLSIARALIKKPEIYIFDDSFSALDFKTDAALRSALEKETTNSTVLIVAQRIGTIMNANQIIVLDEGRIVGKGKHDELMKKCKVYREIALSQLSKEELANE